MRDNHRFANPKWIYFCLLLVAVFSLTAKLNTLKVGAPYVTIDDQTMYEGGFLVWFGQAPPQRMYLESWVSGLVSISTYAAKAIASGDGPGINLVADAYRDFYQNPDPYVVNYRIIMLLIDMLTAFLVFSIARHVFREDRNRDLIAALATGFYLLSYNTLWCYVVARPDTLMTFFSTLGLWFYYRSEFGEKRTAFLFSGVSFGLATGMKLHGAFFVIFICIDMWRVLGFRVAFERLLLFGILSVISFAVAAGSALYDPLLYIKLRLLNARDDASPWLAWGEQFIAMSRGSGWVLVPVLLATTVYAIKRGYLKGNDRLSSLILLSFLWLLLFASIRVLRAYWMLPALPLFYLVASYGLSRISKAHWRYPATALVLGVMGWQTIAQVQSFKSTPFDELRDWVRNNIEPTERFYILGYSAVNLPRNTKAISEHANVINRSMASAVDSGESFTERHIRLWEERARLRLYDMLNFRVSEGYSYHSYHLIHPTDLPGGVLSESVQYVFLQDHFSLDNDGEVERELESHYRQVAEVVGPGGGGDGLSYKVYQRIE